MIYVMGSIRDNTKYEISRHLATWRFVVARHEIENLLKSSE